MLADIPHQDTNHVHPQLPCHSLAFPAPPSVLADIGKHFRWGTPSPSLRNIPVTYDQFARGLSTRKSHIASSSSGESIAVHRQGNIALRSEIVHRLHPSTYHNELSGAVWSTMLEAGSTIRQDEVLDNRIIFSGERLLSFYFPV
jgi:hypothetical protein